MASQRYHKYAKAFAVGLAVLFLAAACGATPSDSETFVIYVRGSRAALETYDLTSNDMNVLVGELSFSGTFQRRLEVRLGWDELLDRSIAISSSKGDMTISTITVKPFLCRHEPAFERRLAAGWHITETHEAYLDADGRLSLDTDFDHRLDYRCEQASPDESDGDGLGTIVHTEPVCDDANRGATAVRVRGTALGRDVDATMTACWAVLNDIGEGQIRLQLLATTDFGQITVGAAHCLASPTEMFPAELPAADAPGCPTAVSAALWQEGVPERWLAISGVWTIRKASYVKGGRVEGQLELRARDEDGTDLTISGPYDLAFIRVPVEGDWHP